MSNVDGENNVLNENPHPEADAGALNQGAEGQEQDLQECSGDDSVEEGTEAELEAEDEAVTHQDDGGLGVRREVEAEIADTNSDAEDCVIQVTGRNEGGLEESEKSLTEDDSVGACGGSMIEADFVGQRSLTEADIGSNADNDHTEADTIESPGSDGTDIVHMERTGVCLVNELTEADVGVINCVEGMKTEEPLNTHNAFAASQEQDCSESDGSLRTFGSGDTDTVPDTSRQNDTTEVDLAIQQETHNLSSAITGDFVISPEHSGISQNTPIQETDEVKIVCIADDVKVENDCENTSANVFRNSENSSVLEDEISSVPFQGGSNLLTRPGLQHAESEESYEPECDQDSDEVRSSPHHTSHVQDSDEVRISPQHITGSCEDRNSVNSVYDSDVLVLPNHDTDHVRVSQEPSVDNVCQGQQQNDSELCDQVDVVQDHHATVSSVSNSPQQIHVVLSDSGETSQDTNTHSVNHQCSNSFHVESNNLSSPKTDTSSASEMAAGISLTCPVLSSENNDASCRCNSPERAHSFQVIQNTETSNQNCDIQTKCQDLEDDDLLDELECELTENLGGAGGEGASFGRVTVAECYGNDPNGLVDLNGRLDAKVRGQLESLQQQLLKTRRQLQQKEAENEILCEESENHQQHAEAVIKERDSYLRQLQQLKTNNPADDLYLPQIKELEFTIAQQQGEIKGWKDKLTSHDSAAKRAIATLQNEIASQQNEMKLRVDQVTKMYEDAKREKDSMVVKYAQSENNFLEVKKMKERLEGRLREAAREREAFNSKAKEFKAEKKRLMVEMESKSLESQGVSKDLEKAKEALSSQEVRIKWAQNKLKAELEAHKDTKAVLEKTNMKLKEAKEETEQIRKDCQAIVKTYQESEEIKSNSLDHQLKRKQSELLLQRQEKTDQEEVHQATLQELDQLKKKHKETLSELQTLKEKLSLLENSRQQSEQTVSKLKDMVQKQKRDNKELQDRNEELSSVETDFRRAQSTIKSLDSEITELKISNKDLLIDMDACRKRETEKLELTEKLSAKNAELQSENTLLHSKGMTLSSDVATHRIELQSLECKVKELTESLKKEQSLHQQEVGDLTTKLEEKTKAVEELSRKVEDEKDEIKTLKRKHANNIKDLTRQLQQTRRRLETFESNGERDTTSMGSRTSSNGSLNTACNAENVNNAAVPPTINNHVPSRHSSPPQEQPEYPVITEQVEPDRQLLIERIVKLQRSHARKNEKIEFMADHISQLVDQIQKKNKIIQSYALREESGTLTPELMDLNKTDRGRLQAQAQLSKKHSIMASLYGSHQTDGTMTLDLSLEINRKLQAVLEDSLLKNITLKESIDTLGGEISRLSQENRQLQLKSHTKKPAR